VLERRFATMPSKAVLANGGEQFLLGYPEAVIVIGSRHLFNRMLSGAGDAKRKPPSGMRRVETFTSHFASSVLVRVTSCWSQGRLRMKNFPERCRPTCTC
jgi:hypothetical protein